MTCSEITDCYPPQVSTSMEKIDKDNLKTHNKEESSLVYLTSIELALNVSALKYLLQQTSNNQT